MRFGPAEILWLVARRTVARRWSRLAATLAACSLSIGLLAGSLQFAFQVQAALSGSEASQYARVAVLLRRNGGGILDESVRAKVASLPGVAAVAGDADVTCEVGGADRTVVAGPPGSGTSLRPWLDAPTLSAYRLVAGAPPAAPDEVVIVRHLATTGHLRVDDRTTLLLPKTSRAVRITGIATVDGQDSAADGDLVLGTVDTVRSAAGLPAGGWPQLLVGAADPVTAAALRDRITAQLGPDVTATTGSDKRAQQIRAVQERGTAIAGNLSMLALIGIFVGLFVVAGTFGTLVRQRARELALLRVVGMTPRQVRLLIRLEAVMVGVISSVAGIIIGLGVARLFAWQLSDTLDVSGAGIQLDPAYLIIPLIGGLLVTWLATMRPASIASRVPPVQALSHSGGAGRRRYRGRLVGALVLFGFAGAMLAAAFSARRDYPGPQGTSSAGAGVVVAALITISALAVLMPLFASRLGGLVGRVGQIVRRDVGGLARAFIRAAPQRVASAASMLMLTVALSCVAWMLVTSVRRETAALGERTLRADRVATVSTGAGLPDDVAQRVSRLPEVGAAARLRQTTTPVVGPIPPSRVRGRPSVVAPLTVTGTDLAALPRLVSLGKPEAAIVALRDGEVAVSAETADVNRWPVGTTLVLRGVRGTVALHVAVTYPTALGTFVGDAVLNDATFDRLDPAAFTGAVLVIPAAGVDGTRLVAALHGALGSVPAAVVLDRSGYAALQASAVLFGVGLLYLFIGAAVITALFGVATTLSLSVFERTREFGMLRAVGAEGEQIRAIVRWETATVVLLGAGLGVGTGVLTVAATHLVTRSDLVSARLPVPALLAIVCAAAAVVALASLLPARRAAQVPVLEATQAE
jgi:putative ABC transport system permease protein